MEVKLSDEMVEKVVATEIQKRIAESLTKDPQKLIEKVVTAALTKPSDNKMIQVAAKEAFAEWLDKHKRLIRAALLNQLSQQPKDFVETIVDGIIEGMSKSFYVSFNYGRDD